MNDEFLRYFWKDKKIVNSQILNSVPGVVISIVEEALNKKISDNNFSFLKNFMIGICDAAAIIPGTESSAYGANGLPRIQIEVDNPRWQLNVYMSVIFEKIFRIPVNNINWPHPTIKSRKKPNVSQKHNHQFRVDLWFYQKLGFNLSIKQLKFSEIITKMDRSFNGLYPVEKFHMQRRKKLRYISEDEYKRIYPNVSGYTTNPFFCADHNEDNVDLPPEIRNKHYAEWRDINFDLGDPTLNEYPSNISKI
jgi:hypothetical protein